VQEAFEMADRVCLMDQGQIMQTGTPAELLFRPANDFVRNFLSEQRLQLEFKVVKLKDIWNYLEDIKPNDQVQNETLNWNQSLWDAIERWSQQEISKDVLTVINEQTNERKEIRSTSILTALNQFKQLY
jgi:osmoprotectant transport system ATP-binding protein